MSSRYFLDFGVSLRSHRFVQESLVARESSPQCLLIHSELRDIEVVRLRISFSDPQFDRLFFARCIVVLLYGLAPTISPQLR